MVNGTPSCIRYDMAKRQITVSPHFRNEDGISQIKALVVDYHGTKYGISHRHINA